jgi:hypothetical protein
MLQMVIKYTNTFHSKGLQNLPKLGIRDWKKPSGNPGLLPSNLDFFCYENFSRALRFPANK